MEAKRSISRRARQGRPPVAALALLGALLLASPRAAADGFIVVPDYARPVAGHFTFAPLEVSFHRVSVRIDGLVAVTTIDQEFVNPGDARLEGTYIFPLPEGSHIDRFSMDVGGRMTDAELLPADKARALYEEIVRRARDPALLEYAGRGAFRARIFPIEPHSRKPIRIEYTQLLKSDAGLVEYVYPLNTEKFSSALLREASVKVTLNADQPLKSVYCPSHDAEIRRDGEKRAVVGWEGRDVRPDTDFKVIFSRSANPLGIDLLTNRKAGEEGTFLLLASPGSPAGKAMVQPKDICLVLDTSGSMAGAKLEQAKRALRFCLANLNPGDRFEVLRFSTEAERLFGALTQASPEKLKQAERFVAGLRPAGGTAIGSALESALALSGGGAARPFLVIFLTDGLPTVGETREEPLVAGIRKAARMTRIFAFGIGHDVNTHLLDRIAGQTRGVSQYVLPEEDIEVKVSSFYAKIREPVLTSLTFTITNPAIRVTQLFPADLPDLFSGDMLMVFGRYSGSGASAIRISGSFGGRPHEFVADASFPEADPDNPFLPRLWAVRRVGWLLDEIRMHGESPELKEEVVRLAHQHGIVTPYTAYLILEDEERRGVSEELRSFQELEKDRRAVSSIREKLDSVRREAASEESRSGKAAVANSMALQELKSGRNLAQAQKKEGLDKSAPAPAAAAGKLGYRAEQAGNYAQQVQVVNGRAFYQNNGVWTDSTAQMQGKLKQKRVTFASEEYFTLLRSHPDLTPWLALGREVDVVVDGTLYNIRAH